MKRETKVKIRRVKNSRPKRKRRILKRDEFCVCLKFYWPLGLKMKIRGHEKFLRKISAILALFNK